VEPGSIRRLTPRFFTGTTGRNLGRVYRPGDFPFNVQTAFFHLRQAFFIAVIIAVEYRHGIIGALFFHPYDEAAADNT
jgi:hypothetical protein